MRATKKRIFEKVAAYGGKDIGVASVVENGQVFLQVAIIGSRTQDIAAISAFTPVASIQEAESLVESVTLGNLKDYLAPIKVELKIISQFKDALAQPLTEQKEKISFKKTYKKQVY